MLCMSLEDVTSAVRWVTCLAAFGFSEVRYLSFSIWLMRRNVAKIVKFFVETRANRAGVSVYAGTWHPVCLLSLSVV